jgi:hypothetical protein
MSKTRKPAHKQTASVVPTKYRDKYRDGSCGDALAAQLHTHITNDDGTTNLAKLKALAQLNGVWRANYAKLNAGMQRMCVGNRMRALDKVKGL